MNNQVTQMFMQGEFNETITAKGVTKTKEILMDEFMQTSNAISDSVMELQEIQDRIKSLQKFIKQTDQGQEIIQLKKEAKIRKQTITSKTHERLGIVRIAEKCGVNIKATKQIGG